MPSNTNVNIKDASMQDSVVTCCINKLYLISITYIFFILVPGCLRGVATPLIIIPLPLNKYPEGKGIKGKHSELVFEKKESTPAL